MTTKKEIPDDRAGVISVECVPNPDAPDMVCLSVSRDGIPCEQFTINEAAKVLAAWAGMLRPMVAQRESSNVQEPSSTEAGSDA